MIRGMKKEKRENMQSINEIKEILSRCSIDALPAQLKQWEGDSRKGVQNVLTFSEKIRKAFAGAGTLRGNSDL
jgi:hypothetical protein